MEKTKGELLKEQLFLNRKDAAVVMSDEELKKSLRFLRTIQKIYGRS